MRRNTIRFVIILAAVAIIGITVTQVYWVKKVFDIKEREFNLNVHNSLLKVSERLCDCDRSRLPARDPVDQLSSNYYVVLVNDIIDPVYLDYYLKDEFSKRNIKMDFEYGIYDCREQNMIFTKYVKFDGVPDPEMAKADFPKLDKDSYYFGIYFPGKTGTLISQMEIWIFSSFVLLIVIIFFSYTLFVILKQKRLSEIQEDFINNMTHEFKTPISTIAVSSEVLKDPQITKSPGRLLNYATIIQNESKRLQKQVERVLQMVTMEKDEMHLKKEDIDVHEIIKNAIDSIKIPLREKQGAIEYDLKAEKTILKADKLHLTNIIYNLLDNAIKYCKNAPVVKLITQNVKNGIKIIVKDNGIGIDQGHHKKIFNKFFRVPTGNLHDVKGFGLGLNYVNLIVKAHRGTIEVKSNKGSGSEFSIFIPYK